MRVLRLSAGRPDRGAVQPALHRAFAFEPPLHGAFRLRHDGAAERAGRAAREEAGGRRALTFAPSYPLRELCGEESWSAGVLHHEAHETDTKTVSTMGRLL